MRGSQHAEAPSGTQWTIGHGRHLAVVTEVGATLRTYTYDGEPVVDGFEVAEWSHGGRGQVLAPWPNRLGDGRYAFGAHQAQAALDEPAHANAIHGLVRWLPWSSEVVAQNVVAARCLLRPTPAYPFFLSLRVEYRLGRHGLVCTAKATNVGNEPLPFGIGFHPYVTVGTELIDAATLGVPATSRLLVDARGLPTGEAAPVGGSELDFTTPRPLGQTKLDMPFCGLRRHADGRARVTLRHPAGKRALELWVDEHFEYLMCFTGDTLEPDRRRRSIAVEPMSCPPDAFRSGKDLVVLAPGGSWSGSWGLEPCGPTGIGGGG